MKIDPKIIDIANKVSGGDFLTKEDIIHLLKVKPHSIEAGFIMAFADNLNRDLSDRKAEVHVQIGLNLSPCPNNCSFCSFATKNKVFTERYELNVEDAIDLSLKAESAGANAIFFMTTGDYPFGKFIEISKEIRKKLKSDTIMIANIGDFSYKEAKYLKEVGYTGIYHAIRMGEGRDTQISPETRLNTIRNALEAGLKIGTCVEPIGPEHSIDEIAEKILIGREIEPCFSGAMRRINIPNSAMEKFGMISEYRLAFIVSVVRLAMGQELIGNCTHEPNILSATGGANLFWAETGTNPRDTEYDTSKGRGFDIKRCRKIFQETDFDILIGPSVIWNKVVKN